MNQKNKISLIIPVYNVEKHLRQCLDSVINQTYKNIEIICVNDGSTDNSAKILEEYAEKDSRIIVINQNNQGQGVARNNALKIATGNYVAFVDSDDMCANNMYEIMYNAAEKFNVDIVQCDFNMYFDKDKTLKYKNTRKIKNKKFLKSNTILTFKDYKHQIFNVDANYSFTRLFKKELIDKYSLEFLPLKHMEDHYFNILARIFCDNMYFIPQALYSYRVYENSSSCIAPINAELVTGTIADKLQDNARFKTLKKQFEEYVANCFVWEYWKTNDYKEKQILLEKISQKYSRTINKIFKKIINGESKYTFWEQIFSLKNNANKTHKVVTILGIKFKFRRNHG